MKADGEIQPGPLRGRIFNNVRATYTPPETPTCLFQLYYGPSSNFSFLQHIHSHLTTRRASQSISEGNDGDEGIDKFKYKRIVFGSVTSQGRNGSPVFLRYELARSFLQHYLSTTHHFMPLLDTERLWSTFERLYNSRNRGYPIEPLDKASVIITMAMGAISTEEEDWRETLLAQARTEAESVRYHVNVKAVQIALLMAHCEFATGHPNLAYLCLGSAVTKALAAGIHKESRGSDSHSEASQTMWNVFCNESISCLMIGRPYLLDRDNITVPVPTRRSFMAALIQLCMTIRRTHRLYFHHEVSNISGLIRSAHDIRRELESFSELVKEDIGVSIGGGTTGPVAGEELIWHIVTNYLHFYTMLLAFRPLLLLQIELSRLANAETSNDSRPKTNHHKMPLLLEAREHCICAARSIVSFSESLLLTITGVQGVCNHGYFLESACFVLVLAAVQDTGPAAASHVQYITRGLTSLRKLVQREPVRSVVAALERMLEKLNARREGSDTLMTAEEQYDNAMSGFPATFQMEEEVPSELLAQSSNVAQSGFWADLNQGFLDSVGGDGLLDDLMWPNMDWGVDFSVLDVEEFVSVLGSQQGSQGMF